MDDAEDGWDGEMDPDEAMAEYGVFEQIESIVPGYETHRIEHVSAALGVAVPYRIPEAETNMQTMRNALVQATHLGQPLSERFRRHMTLPEYLDAVIHQDEPPRAFVQGVMDHVFSLEELRANMLQMAPFARMIVRISHANLLDLRTLFAPDPQGGIGFMVSISVLATTHYSDVRSPNTANTYAVYQHLFGLGEYLFPVDDQDTWSDVAMGWQLPEDGSDKPTAVITTRMPIEITAVPRPAVTEYQARRRYRAGGFKDVMLPPLLLEARGGAVLYFPPCKPDMLQDCLLACVTQAFAEDAGNINPAEFDRFIIDLGRLRKSPDGMTAYSIKTINKILYDYRDKFGIKAFVTHASRGEHNTFVELNLRDRAAIWKDDLEDGMKNIFITRVDYSGRFTMQRNFKPVNGGLHYVMLSTLALTESDFDELEQGMFEHIGAKHPISFAELFETNKKLQEAEAKTMAKEKRVKKLQLEKSAERSKDLLIAVCDLECLVERYPGDEMDLDEEELKKAHDEASMVHIPCTFAWGVVNVEKPLAQLWPGEGEMPPTETMTREQGDALCRAVFQDLRGPGGPEDGGEPELVKIHQGTSAADYANCLADGLDAMFDYMALTGSKYMLALFHNFSKYDGPQMLRHLRPNGPVGGAQTVAVDTKCFLKTSRGILRMGYKRGGLRIVMQCSKVHYTDSLENLCESFRLPLSHRKKPWNFNEDFITRTRLRSADFTSRLLDYGIYDIYSLGLVVCRMEEAHRELFPITPKDKKPRLAFITYQQYLRAWLESAHLKLTYAPSMLPDYEAILLKSLRGGVSLALTREYCTGKWARILYADMDGIMAWYGLSPGTDSERASERDPDDLADMINEWVAERDPDLPPLIPTDLLHRYPELFQDELKQIYDDPDSLISLDNNSLFPYALTHPVPIGPGHMLDSHQSTELLLRMASIDHPREWGIVMCRIRPDSFPADCPPLLSRRREGGGLLYGNYPEEAFEAPFTSHDLIVYYWAGANIDILYGVWWTEDDELSNEYIPVMEKLYDLKSTAPTESLRRLYKGATVSVYGTTGYDVHPTKDILQPPGEFHVDESELIVSDVNSQLSAILPSCNIVHLKARFTHQFGRSSNKATITNCVLSRSRYHMYRCVRMVAMKRYENLGISATTAFYYGLRAVNYIDTDSLFVKQEWFPYFEACGLISDRMGDFKNDYGRGVLPYMLAPAAKTRFTEIVKYNPNAALGEPKYTVGTILKFKGMPCVKGMASASGARRVYLDLIENFQVSLRKMSWKKGLAGVSTSMTDATTSRESLMRDKKGLRIEVGARGAVRVRNLFHGDSLEASVEYPDLTIPPNLSKTEREARCREVEGDFLAFTLKLDRLRGRAYATSLTVTSSGSGGAAPPDTPG